MNWILDSYKIVGPHKCKLLLPVNTDLPMPQPVQGQLPTPSVDPPSTELLVEEAAAIMVDSPESYPNALRLLHSLKANMELIPEDVPLAQLNHPLAVFFLEIQRETGAGIMTVTGRC